MRVYSTKQFLKWIYVSLLWVQYLIEDTATKKRAAAAAAAERREDLKRTGLTNTTILLKSEIEQNLSLVTEMLIPEGRS